MMAELSPGTRGKKTLCDQNPPADFGHKAGADKNKEEQKYKQKGRTFKENNIDIDRNAVRDNTCDETRRGLVSICYVPLLPCYPGSGVAVPQSLCYPATLLPRQRQGSGVAG